MACERHLALWALGSMLMIAGVAHADEQPTETCYRTDAGRIVKRRVPGAVEVPCPPPGVPTNNAPPVAQPGAGTTSEPQQQAVPLSPEFTRGPPPAASPIPQPGINDFVDSVPVPDRWRIVDTLGKGLNYVEPYNYKNNFLDPYNRNNLKADKPFYSDWFFNVSALSDTTYEWRNLEAGIDPAAEQRPGSNDTFGHGGNSSTVEELTADFTLYQGDTTFRPPQWQFRLTPVFNYNYTHADEVGVINIDPRKGTNRSDDFLGLQNAFVERRLDVASERFDFDSVRVGIQPFSSDFRGFLFQDNQLGVRFFGTRDNNIFQYNLAYFRRLEKDTNSGLNDLTQPLRHDDIVVANLYWQDMPVKGFTSQGIVLFNHNTEGDEPHYDSNGFPVRPAQIGLDAPHDYEVVYVGYNGDGHFGRTNATVSLYYVTGHEQPGVFVEPGVDISAGFGALEVSRDFDWIRGRVSVLYATGDSNPYDRRATGFDAPFENPQFAGGDTSYWISQALPLIGGGGVTLTSGNGVLADLRSSKGEGQSNFDNPGVFLAGLGADVDLLPQLRLTLNANNIQFANTAVLAALRAQPIDGREVGQDVSVALTYRPLMSQNIVLRTAYARLFAGNAFNSLFPHMDPNYVLVNLIVAY